MQRWIKDEKDFNVSLDENSSSHIFIVERLSIPSKTKFVIKGKKILVNVGKK